MEGGMEGMEGMVGMAMAVAMAINANSIKKNVAANVHMEALVS